MAPPVGAFLGCRLFSSRGDLSRAGDRGFRTARPAPSHLCSPRCPGRCGRGQSRRRGRQLQGNARGQRASVPRRARLGVSRSRTFMAVAADRGIGCLVRDSVPRAAQNTARSSITPISPTSSSTALFRSPCSMLSACSPSPGPISPSPISGASGWCTSGSKISWSCSPRSWWPTSSCCWESCPQGQRLA